jgi:hypothetical protein
VIIIGIHFFTWGWVTTTSSLQCGRCGHLGEFIAKKSMRFLTLFFIIPVLPLSGVSHLIDCPKCRTRYEVATNAANA